MEQESFQMTPYCEGSSRQKGGVANSVIDPFFVRVTRPR
jgi:hypothetical protein